MRPRKLCGGTRQLRFCQVARCRRIWQRCAGTPSVWKHHQIRQTLFRILTLVLEGRPGINVINSIYFGIWRVFAMTPWRIR
jgi:hypothetical protein